MIDVSRKLQAASLVCLMVASTLAAIPPTIQAKAIMDAANLTVPGNYANLQELAKLLHNAAVAYKSMAESNRQDGTLAKWDTTFREHRAALLAPPTSAKLHQLYTRAVAKGYKGTYDDFTKYVRRVGLAGREKAYSTGTHLGLYRVMLNAAAGFQKAADGINSSLASAHPTVHLSYVGIRYHPLLIQDPFCSAIDWGLTFLMVTSAFTPNMILAPFWGAAGLIWFGVARPESGC